MQHKAVQIALVGLLLLAGSGAFSTVLSGQPDSLDQLGRNSVLRLIWPIFYLYAVVGILRRPRQIWNRVRRDKWIAILVSLAFVSVLWSINPQYTLWRGVALLGTAAAGICLANELSQRDFLNSLALTFGIVIAASYIIGVVAPDIAIHSDEHMGSWRGALPHKNDLGRMMALATLTFLVLALDVPRRRGIYVLGICGAVPLLVLSKSITGVMGLAAAFILVSVGRSARIDFRLFGAGLIIAVATLGGMLSLHGTDMVGAVLGSLGRDATLTGRTLLWLTLVEFISQKLVLGYGFGAFWISGSDITTQVWLASGWMPLTAHSGYIDVILATGITGFVIFVIALFQHGVRALGELRMGNYWPAALLAFLAVVNIAETTLLRQNNIFWLAYVIAAIHMAETSRTDRVPANGQHDMRA